MERLTAADIVLATRGALLRGAQDRAVSGISTDTRTMRPGDFFIALRGKNFDGHAFLSKAAQGGACGCLIGKGHEAGDIAAAPPDFVLIRVDDTNRAYGDIARLYRNLFFDLSVAAVTGSNGKSTTKEMAAELLSQKFRVLKNKGTLNNLVGVPQTLLGIDWQTEAAVLEIGTSLHGEIARLAEITRPDVGVLTNIGPSHLEFLGDLEGVAREKGSLAEALPARGCLVANADDALAWRLRERTQANVLGYGFSEAAAVRATEPFRQPNGCWGFSVHIASTGERAQISLPVLGRHNIANALAAIATGSWYGVELELMQSALEKFQGLAMRVQMQERSGVRIINDAYNANPQSLARSLEVLEDVQAPGRKIVVFGDMLELGASERQDHERAGEGLAMSAASLVVTVGRRASWAAESFARGKRKSQKIARFADTEGAASFLKDIVREGDLMLLKGSRGMRLERLLDQLFTAGAMTC